MIRIWLTIGLSEEGAYPRRFGGLFRTFAPVKQKDDPGDGQHNGHT